MPLSFMYGNSITRKEGFTLDALPAHLRDLQAKANTWTTGYSVDLELTFKKFKELESIQPFFPTDMPIYFASGEYRAEQLEMADFLTLLDHPTPLFLYATFDPKFVIFFRMRSPHIRGFDYYNPDLDSDDMHLLEMRSWVGDTDKSREIKKAFYEILRNEVEIPPYEEVILQEAWKSPDGSFIMGEECSTPLRGYDIALRFTDSHLMSIHKVLSRLPELANNIVLLNLFALTGTRETIRNFMTNRRTMKVFKLSKWDRYYCRRRVRKYSRPNYGQSD